MDTSTEGQVARHEDERQILATLHRYAHSCDYGPEREWLDCFTEDGVWETRRGVFAVEGLPLKRFQGQAELAELFASFEHALTKHVVVAPRIEIDGDRCVVHTYYIIPAAHRTGPFILAFGRYRDRLVRCSDGRWRIEERIGDVDGTHPLAEPMVGTDVSQSLAIEEIKRLKARYCRYLDAKRWPEWAELFTEDARMWLVSREGEEVLEGRPAILARLSGMLAEVATVHEVLMPDIEIARVFDDSPLGWDAMQRISPGGMSPTKAHGTWDTISIIAAGSNADTGASERRWGRHEEHYERGDDDRWRIRSLRVTELHIERG